MGILGIINLLFPLLTIVLQNRGVISANTTGLISSLVTASETLFSALRSGASKSNDALAVLGALSGVIATLKADTKISPTVLAQLDALDKDVQAALIAEVQSEKGIDLSVLTPIAPIV